jgi:hypothetical protein
VEGSLETKELSVHPAPSEQSPCRLGATHVGLAERDLLAAARGRQKGLDRELANELPPLGLHAAAAVLSPSRPTPNLSRSLTTRPRTDRAPAKPALPYRANMP